MQLGEQSLSSKDDYGYGYPWSKTISSSSVPNDGTFCGSNLRLPHGVLPKMAASHGRLIWTPTARGFQDISEGTKSLPWQVLNLALSMSSCLCGAQLNGEQGPGKLRLCGRN